MGADNTEKTHLDSAKYFKFTSYDFKPEIGTAYLRYAVDDIPFEEKLVFVDAQKS